MAIEGAPRLPDNRDKLTDTTDGVESTPQVQPPDAWQQFKDRIFGPKPEVDPEKDSDEEDDESEDDEVGEVTTVKGKSKSNRFRRALRGLIAQKAEVPDGEGRGAVPADTVIQSQNHGENDTEGEWQFARSEENHILGEQGTLDQEITFGEHDVLPKVSASYDQTGRAEINASLPSNESDSTGASEVIETENGIPTLENQPTAVAAPEDLRTILERQHHLRAEQTAEAGEIGRMSPDSGIIFESRSGAATGETVPVVDRPDNTAALLAVDLLSHRAGKRRDKKIEAASIARDKDLDHRLQQGNKVIEDKLLHQQKVQRELEQQLQKKEHALPRVRHAAEFPLPAENNRERLTNKVVENTTQDRADFLSSNVTQNFELRATPEKPIVAIPDIALPSAETILHRVETAAEKGVPIETEYELRHERKGNNDYTALEETSAVVEQQLQQTNQNLRQLKSLEGAKNALRAERKADDYKQAVASGAWGAVVGVLLFVAYIMLTR